MAKGRDSGSGDAAEKTSAAKKIEIKEIKLLSLAKILTIIWSIMGFFSGLFHAVAGQALNRSYGMMGQYYPMMGNWQGASLGIWAIIVYPIMYATLGFIMGVITAFVYNLVAGWMGGIELKV